MTGVLKRGDQDIDTCLKVRSSEDTGNIWPSLRQGERRDTDTSIMALKRNQPCQHFELILLDPKTVRNSEINFCSLSHPVYGTSLWKP